MINVSVGTAAKKRTHNLKKKCNNHTPMSVTCIVMLYIYIYSRKEFTCFVLLLVCSVKRRELSNTPKQPHVQCSVIPTGPLSHTDLSYAPSRIRERKIPLMPKNTPKEFSFFKNNSTYFQCAI